MTTELIAKYTSYDSDRKYIFVFPPRFSCTAVQENRAFSVYGSYLKEVEEENQEASNAIEDQVKKQCPLP